MFDDGCIYLYEKDVPTSAKEDYRKSMMQITTNQGKDSHKEGKNMISKSDVILKMQSIVEDFDFERCYGPAGAADEKKDSKDKKKDKNKPILEKAFSTQDGSDGRPSSTGKKEVLHSSHEDYYGMISSSSRIYEQKYKQYNYSVAYYSKFDKVINPKLIMRFDCK